MRNFLICSLVALTALTPIHGTHVSIAFASLGGDCPGEPSGAPCPGIDPEDCPDAGTEQVTNQYRECAAQPYFTFGTTNPGPSIVLSVGDTQGFSVSGYEANTTSSLLEDICIVDSALPCPCDYARTDTVPNSEMDHTADGEAINWSVSGGIGTISSGGTLTVTGSGTGIVTPTVRFSDNSSPSCIDGEVSGMSVVVIVPPPIEVCEDVGLACDPGNTRSVPYGDGSPLSAPSISADGGVTAIVMGGTVGFTVSGSTTSLDPGDEDIQEKQNGVIGGDVSCPCIPTSSWTQIGSPQTVSGSTTAIKDWHVESSSFGDVSKSGVFTSDGTTSGTTRIYVTIEDTANGKYKDTDVTSNKVSIDVVEVTEIELKDGVAESLEIGDSITKEDLVITTNPEGYEDLVTVATTSIGIGENIVEAVAGTSIATTKIYGVSVTGGWGTSDSISGDTSSFESGFSFTVNGATGTWSINGANGGPGGTFQDGDTVSGAANWDPSGSSHELRLAVEIDELDGPIVLAAAPIVIPLVLTGVGVGGSFLFAYLSQTGASPQINPSLATNLTVQCAPADVNIYNPNTITATVVADIGGTSWFRSLNQAYTGTTDPSLEITVDVSDVKTRDTVQFIDTFIDVNSRVKGVSTNAGVVIQSNTTQAHDDDTLYDVAVGKFSMQNQSDACIGAIDIDVWPGPNPQLNGSGFDNQKFQSNW